MWGCGAAARGYARGPVALADPARSLPKFANRANRILWRHRPDRKSQFAGRTRTRMTARLPAGGTRLVAWAPRRSAGLSTCGHLVLSELEALADRLEQARAAALADRERARCGPEVATLCDPASR
jgi:hypothetical protein